MTLNSWMRAYFSEHLTLISRGILSSSLAGNYMLKVNYKNNRASCEICSYVVGVALSLFLTLNTFHTLFWCFYCELWEGKCRLGDWWYCRCLLRTLPNIYDGAFLCKYFHFFWKFPPPVSRMQNHLTIHFDQGNCYCKATIFLIPCPYSFRIFFAEYTRIWGQFLSFTVSTYSLVFSEQHFILSTVNQRVISNIK